MTFISSSSSPGEVAAQISGTDPNDFPRVWQLGNAAFQDIVFLNASTTWDAGSINDGAEETKDINVPGAELGDFVMASCSIDVADLALTGQVTAANTVTLQLLNNTGGAVDLDSGTYYIRVMKRV